MIDNSIFLFEINIFEWFLNNILEKSNISPSSLHNDISDFNVSERLVVFVFLCVSNSRHDIQSFCHSPEHSVLEKKLENRQSSPQKSQKPPEPIFSHAFTSINNGKYALLSHQASQWQRT